MRDYASQLSLVYPSPTFKHQYGLNKLAKKTKKISKDKVLELDGWKVGDFAWGKLSTGEECYGEIKTLHFEDQLLGDSLENTGPAVTMIMQIDSKYRCISTSTLTENPTKKGRAALKRKTAASLRSNKKK